VENKRWILLSQQAHIIQDAVIRTDKVQMEGFACQRMGKGAHNQGEEGRGRKIMCATLPRWEQSVQVEGAGGKVKCSTTGSGAICG